MKKHFKIISLIFAIIFLVAILFIAKPAGAVPPPASKIWLWWWITRPEAVSQMVRVEVTWKEGVRDEKVELKTILKDTSP